MPTLESTRAPGVQDALGALSADAGDAAWSRLVQAVHDERERLGMAWFDEVIGLVRAAVRARLDRSLAYSA